MNSTLIASAGEFFVAHRLSCLGFIAAPVRAGSPAADLLACRSDGDRTVAIQVKTTTWADRTKGRGEKKAVARVEFPLGHAAIERAPKALIYCFVDLRINPGDSGPAKAVGHAESPVVYVIPARDLLKKYAGQDIRKHPWLRLHQPMEWMRQFRDNWNPVVRALS